MLHCKVSPTFGAAISSREYESNGTFGDDNQSPLQD